MSHHTNAAEVLARLQAAHKRAVAKGDMELAKRVAARFPNAAAIAKQENREMDQAQAEFDRIAYLNDY